MSKIIENLKIIVAALVTGFTCLFGSWDLGF